MADTLTLNHASSWKQSLYYFRHTRVRAINQALKMTAKTNLSSDFCCHGSYFKVQIQLLYTQNLQIKLSWSFCISLNHVPISFVYWSDLTQSQTWTVFWPYTPAFQCKCINVLKKKVMPLTYIKLLQYLMKREIKHTNIQDICTVKHYFISCDFNLGFYMS